MKKVRLYSLFFMTMIPILTTCAQSPSALDERVSAYLEEQRRNWRDLNVPYQDGKVLHDIIVQKSYTRALEIGTSTGHSGIWIAWALSKTGGKLITLEIDPDRHRQAVDTFRKLGLSPYVDARLGDAHRLAKEVEGPFDFVFSDADKEWYKQYFVDVDPKLVAGGCFTAHNVANPYGGIRDFLQYVQSLPNYETTIDRSSSSGISISYKSHDRR
jgi:caffeoyl-CoA O-methyltransferase